MKLKKAITVLILALVVPGTYAQEKVPPVRIMDIRNVATKVYGISSSSSTSSQSPDFTVLRGGSRRDVNFNDLTWLIVRHDIPTDNDIYITVELTFKSGKTETLEMIRSIRFTGRTDNGDFSILVKDINTLQVMHGPA
jgi:hypothetical protein